MDPDLGMHSAAAQALIELVNSPNVGPEASPKQNGKRTPDFPLQQSSKRTPPGGVGGIPALQAPAQQFLLPSAIDHLDEHRHQPALPRQLTSHQERPPSGWRPQTGSSAAAALLIGAAHDDSELVQRGLLLGTDLAAPFLAPSPQTMPLQNAGAADDEEAVPPLVLDPSGSTDDADGPPSPRLAEDSSSAANPNADNHLPRKDWTAEEDARILAAVELRGYKWRQIAAMVPGRSDDAVRNRWNRIKHGLSSAGIPSIYHCSKCGQVKKAHRCMARVEDRQPRRGSTGASDGELMYDSGGEGSSGGVLEERRGPGDDRKRTERFGWTAQEDAMIIQSVEEFGCRWQYISKKIPTRTEHAIRNRWHRLQTMSKGGEPSRPHVEAAVEAYPVGALSGDGSAPAQSFGPMGEPGKQDKKELPARVGGDRPLTADHQAHPLPLQRAPQPTTQAEALTVIPVTPAAAAAEPPPRAGACAVPLPPPFLPLVRGSSGGDASALMLARMALSSPKGIDLPTDSSQPSHPLPRCGEYITTTSLPPPPPPPPPLPPPLPPPAHSQPAKPQAGQMAGGAGGAIRGAATPPVTYLAQLDGAAIADCLRMK